MKAGMTEDDVLERFGLVPKLDDLEFIRQLLVQETERASKHEGNEPLLRLFCIQLFAHGDVNDAPLIWRAKQSNFDAACGIDVQLICGAGLEATKSYLSKIETDEALAILNYLDKSARDFTEWSPQAHLKFWQEYYKLS